MRLGVAWVPSANAHYRAIAPMMALQRRGHEVVWPDRAGQAALSAVRGCDVVLVYRRGDAQTRKLLGELSSYGTPTIWDNDDDMEEIPKESPLYRELGGFKGRQHITQLMTAARNASLVSTTTSHLAAKYAAKRIANVEVVDNYVDTTILRPRTRTKDFVVGWVAGQEHRADSQRIPIAQALRRLQQIHPEVHVVCVGVDLKLDVRYTHHEFVEFSALPRIIGSFDIGIAPLAEIPFNLSRSSIKLKEYAASRIPWLASPRGPYVGLGESHGGHLVTDDQWFTALTLLLRSPRERRKLRRRGAKWASRESIDRAASRWEEILLQACDRRPIRSTI